MNRGSWLIWRTLPGVYLLELSQRNPFDIGEPRNPPS
jgi:hypothetical protein